MVHLRGPPGPMGMRGPGPRPGIWMDGQGPPPMFPRGFEGPPVDGPPPDAFFGRPPFDDMERRAREEGRHPRGWGPRRGPQGSRDEGRFRGGERDGPGPWRRDEEMGPRRGSRPEDTGGKQDEEEKEAPATPSVKGERDRTRKSRWSNASPTSEAAPEPVPVDGGKDSSVETSVEEKNFSLCAEGPQHEQGDGSGDGSGSVTKDCDSPPVAEPQSDGTPCNDELPLSTAEPCSESDAAGGEDAG
ncbi:basic salivary proline-rich protein 4-like [Cryptotermes secundus]|nr:basic salivary proline-rich protein 4-like [Cryptotermes secundus]